MFHIALYDKDPASIRTLTHTLQAYPDPPDTICVHPFSRSDDLVKECREGARYNLVILETMTAQARDLEAAQSIRTYDKQVPIMMVTSTNQYCAEGYKIPLYRYHQNPVPVETLWQDLEALLTDVPFPQTTSLMFHNWEGTHKVLMKDILYLQSIGCQLLIKTTRKEYSMRGSIRSIERKLERYHFIRCHKSYLINMHRVTALTGEELQLDTGEILPIARKRSKKLRLCFEKCVGETI